MCLGHGRALLQVRGLRGRRLGPCHSAAHLERNLMDSLGKALPVGDVGTGDAFGSGSGVLSLGL